MSPSEFEPFEGQRGWRPNDNRDTFGKVRIPVRGVEDLTPRQPDGAGNPEAAAPPTVRMPADGASAQIAFGHREVGPWTLPVIGISDASRVAPLRVFGEIGNSVPTSERGKKVLQAWKVKVASDVRVKRGDMPWDPEDRSVVTLGFSFCPELHGGPRQRLDVENYIKPTLDALAAGLFSELGEDLASIPRWDYDDSNFSTLLIHRLPDASSAADEGVVIFVSAKQVRND